MTGRRRAIVLAAAVAAVLALTGAGGGCDAKPSGGGDDRPIANPDPAPGRPRGAAPSGPGITSTSGDQVRVRFRALWSGRLFGVKGAYNYGRGFEKFAVNDPPWQQIRTLNHGQQVSMTVAAWPQQGFPKQGSMSCRVDMPDLHQQIDFDSNEDNNLAGGVTCQGVVP